MLLSTVSALFKADLLKAVMEPSKAVLAAPPEGAGVDPDPLLLLGGGGGGGDIGGAIGGGGGGGAADVATGAGGGGGGGGEPAATVGAVVDGAGYPFVAIFKK